MRTKMYFLVFVAFFSSTMAYAAAEDPSEWEIIDAEKKSNIKILWVRHGFSCANFIKAFGDSSNYYRSYYAGDAQLTNIGREDVGEAVSKIITKLLNKKILKIDENSSLQRINKENIYTSTLLRTIETADEIRKKFTQENIFLKDNNTRLHILPYISEKRALAKVSKAQDAVKEYIPSLVSSSWNLVYDTLPKSDFSLTLDLDNVPRNAKILGEALKSANVKDVVPMEGSFSPFQENKKIWKFLNPYDEESRDPIVLKPDFELFKTKILPSLYEVDTSLKNGDLTLVVSHSHFMQEAAAMKIKNLGNVAAIYQEFAFSVKPSGEEFFDPVKSEVIFEGIPKKKQEDLSYQDVENCDSWKDETFKNLYRPLFPK